VLIELFARCWLRHYERISHITLTLWWRASALQIYRSSLFNIFQLTRLILAHFFCWGAAGAQPFPAGCLGWPRPRAATEYRIPNFILIADILSLSAVSVNFHLHFIALYALLTAVYLAIWNYMSQYSLLSEFCLCTCSEHMTRYMHICSILPICLTIWRPNHESTGREACLYGS